MNESNRIFSEAVKNINESMKVLSKSMKASVLMLKKCLKMSSCHKQGKSFNN